MGAVPINPCADRLGLNETVTNASSRNHRFRHSPRKTRGLCCIQSSQTQNTCKFPNKFNGMAIARCRVRHHTNLRNQPSKGFCSFSFDVGRVQRASEIVNRLAVPGRQAGMQPQGRGLGAFRQHRLQSRLFRFQLGGGRSIRADLSLYTISMAVVSGRLARDNTALQASAGFFERCP